MRRKKRRKRRKKGRRRKSKLMKIISLKFWMLKEPKKLANKDKRGERRSRRSLLQ